MEQKNTPTKEEIAYMELKGQIVKLMFDWTNKHAAKGPDCLYPDCAYILVDVLTSCLSEAQYQVGDYQPFTAKQVDKICYQIGDWYLEWKNCLTEPYVPHRLGFAKEKLKELICGTEEEDRR